MGIKPASFFHEVTLLKKGLKKQKCMAFGLLQDKPCSSHQQSNNYFLVLLNNIIFQQVLIWWNIKRRPDHL